jgi:hypothetical protein
MSRRGEQGEHFSRFPVLSPRVLAKDLGSAPLLTLLTLAARKTNVGHERGGGA